MKERIKRFLFLVATTFLIVAIFVINYFYSQLQKERQAQQIRELLERLTNAVNLMESVKEEMPKELLEVHEFLVKQIQGKEFKLYQIHPELKGQLIMYHGVKSKGIFVDPSVDLRAEIWIPILYHEAGHLLWHSKYPVETFEAFQEQLYVSEEHSYTVEAQAWNIVKEHFPVRPEGLNWQESKLFNLYEKETALYNRMIEGDPEAKREWIGVIEENIRVQKGQQKILKEY